MSARAGEMIGGSRFVPRIMGFLGIAFLVFFPSPRSVQSFAQSSSSFRMRLDVELVTTEVAVLDKNGKPVQNLKKENFKLYEDGKQQEISSFDEITEDAPRNASQLNAVDDLRRGKTVLILFDDSTIKPVHIPLARDSAAKFVREHMNAQDLFAVAAFDVSMRILQNFTNKRDKVLAAIATPATSSSLLTRQQMAPASTGANRLGNAPADLDKTEELLRAIHSINLSVARLKGQKSVLLYSESLTLNSNSIYYNNAIHSAKKSNVVFFTIDPAWLSSDPVSGENRRLSGDQDISKPSQSALNKTSIPQLFPISLYSGAQDLLGNAMFQGSRGGGSAGGTTGAAGGSGIGRTPAIPPNTNPPESGSNPSNNQQSLLKYLAGDSGGSAIYNTNSVDSELDKLDQQLSNYYILGFQSNNPKHDGAFRKLEIKTDMKSVTLKYRNGYQDRRPVDALASSRQEKSLLETAASPTAATQLPLNFRASYFYDSPQLARILVSTKIQAEKVGLKKKGSQLGSDLNIMGVAYAENGAVSARFSETLHLNVEKDKEPDFRKTGISYSNYFRVRPGKYRLKLVASDEFNNLGSMEQSLELPSAPENGMAVSSLVLAEGIQRLPDLIRELESKLLDDSETFVFSGLQFSPSIENKVAAGTSLLVFFKLYNIGGPNRKNLVSKVKLISEKGVDFPLPGSIPLDANTMSRMGDEAVVGLSLTFKAVTPGKYKLAIETSEAGASQSAKAQTDIEFIQK
jgi:VWFA-related protein